ncbi:MAG TPA: hypothetical protein VJ728_06300 [Candidatus Binataceae bacterium]|nr:hypothetical protein [Candidatus Binataceae bacterium]
MTDNSPPTHRAYVISQPREEGGNGFWHEVGVVWPHKNGNGFDWCCMTASAFTAASSAPK